MPFPPILLDKGTTPMTGAEDVMYQAGNLQHFQLAVKLFSGGVTIIPSGASLVFKVYYIWDDGQQTLLATSPTFTNASPDQMWQYNYVTSKGIKLTAKQTGGTLITGINWESYYL